MPGRGRSAWPAGYHPAGQRPARSGQALGKLSLTPRERAAKRVEFFALRSGNGVFKHISRQEVARGLLERIGDPNRIAQGESSLCGPTALVRTVASIDPLAYVSFVTDLFDFGRGTLRRLIVNPGEDLKNYDPGVKLHVADWIALASLRDSENYFFDYDEVEDQFAGITLPSHLEGWFKKAGFMSVVNDTNLIVDKGVDNILAADALYRRNNWVCLFINMNMLIESEMNSGSFSANHWVMLTSRVQIAAGEINFDVFTWGRGHYSVPQGATPLSVEAFLDNYYGYVAAKY